MSLDQTLRSMEACEPRLRVPVGVLRYILDSGFLFHGSRGIQQWGGGIFCAWRIPGAYPKMIGGHVWGATGLSIWRTPSGAYPGSRSQATKAKRQQVEDRPPQSLRGSPGIGQWGGGLFCARRIPGAYPKMIREHVW